MLRIAIADDDLEFSEQLRQYVNDFAKEYGYNCDITVYHDGDELIDEFNAQFDVILLDVEMPFLNGMAAAEMIRTKDREVILMFITNVAQYAIRGYTVNAMDYVLKPVNYFVFSQRLNRAVQRLGKRKKYYLTLSVKGGTIKLALEDVYYLESRGHRLVYHTRTGNYIAMNSTIEQAENDLKEHNFFRSNRGYLVNLEYVEGICDGCALVCGEKLVISRNRKTLFLDAFTDYLSEVAIN